MVGDKENTHYVVGITGDEYSVILDLDDFNNIKDLTRLKLGLTINGIKILRDKSGKLQSAVDKFNENRLTEIAKVEELKENKDIINYLNNIIDILKGYNIDSQGFLEYMRAKIEHEGIKIEKIWKEARDGYEKRYVRCLIFNFNSKMYLLDSIDKTLKITDRERLEKENFIFNPEEHEYSYYGG